MTFTVGDLRVTGRTSNVSRGGVCALVDQGIPAGTRVEVEMALIFGDASFSEPIQLGGRVVWSTPLESKHQVGLSFLALRPEQVKYLELFLRFLEEGASERRAAGPGPRGPFEP